MNPIIHHDIFFFRDPWEMPSIAGRHVLAWVVSALHWAFVIFMAWAPFSSNRTALVMHALVTPFLWLHWILNDDTCALTLLEKKIRGLEDDSHSFFYALVSPVYKVRDADVRVACWVASIVLWLITISKVRWADVLDVFGFS